MVLNRLLSATALAALLLGAVTTAHAEEETPPVTLTGSVSLTSDYRFRGFAQTDSKPAIQAGVTATHSSGLYAGVWGSNVDFKDGNNASAEVDLSAGYNGTSGDLSYGVGLIYYSYPGSKHDKAQGIYKYDYLEVTGSLSYTAGIFTPSVAIFYSPQFFGDFGAATYLTAGIAAKPTDWLKLYGNVGYQTVDKRGADKAAYFSDNGKPKDNATDYNFGATVTLYGIDLDLKYVDTNVKGEFSNQTIVFSLTKSF